jgi:hypothetical protein
MRLHLEDSYESEDSVYVVSLMIRETVSNFFSFTILEIKNSFEDDVSDVGAKDLDNHDELSLKKKC